MVDPFRPGPPSSGEPREQMTPMADAVAAMHEVFTSLLAGGFTERQACTIIGEMLRGGS